MNQDPRDREYEDRMVPLAKVEMKHSPQARVRIDDARVQFLFDVLHDGGQFIEAPPEVYYDGDYYWVGDGFHRLRAYDRAGRKMVRARVRAGTRRDAFLHALGANATHGLPRKPEDVRKAIRLALEDDELKRKSNRSIAKLVVCHDKTVAAVKRELGLDRDTREYTDRHGNTTVMDVSNLKGRHQTKLIGSGPVNAFHELPAPARDVYKQMLRVCKELPKQHCAFLLAYVKGHLPGTPKEADNQLTELELEEQAAQEDGADRLLPPEE
jgi:hypothetical protein